jgi:quinol monooxygenase YgiN
MRIAIAGISTGLEACLIVEYTRYKIEEKRRVLFERAYEKATEALRSSSHCLSYELSHCEEDANYYTLRIEWDSEEGHLKGFRTSSEFKAFFVLVQPYVKDIEEMRHYKVIAAGEKSQSGSSGS